MSNLTIFFKNYSFMKPALFVNEKQVKIHRENNQFVAYVDCDDKAHIKLMNYHPLLYPFGMLINYFLFLISLLGILDQRYPNKAKRILFDAEISMYSSVEITFKFLPFHIDKPCVEYECDSPLQEFENICSIDSKLQRKIKLLFALKIFTWIAVFLLGIYGIVSILF